MLAAMRQIPINFYYSRALPACVRAKEWLYANQLNVNLFDIDTHPTARYVLRQLRPGRGLPVLQIENRVLVGFSAYQVWSTLAESARSRLRGK